MSKCDAMLLTAPVAELREQLDADSRFRKSLMGLDPRQVNDYIKAQKELADQLQSALDDARQAHETYRRESEGRLADLTAAADRLRQTAQGREQELLKTRRLLEEQAVECQALREQQERDATALRELRESVDKQSLEHMRAQLIAATRESSEHTAQLAVKNRENKQLKARVETLTDDFRRLSDNLAQERENGRLRSLTVDRAAARVKAHAHTGAGELTARLQEAAQLIAACFAEQESLLEQFSAAAIPSQP